MGKLRFSDILLWEDDDYAVINKPPLIATLEDRTSQINILKLAREVYEDAQVCHRLDKETSGALVIAKNPEAYRHMQMQLEDRKVNKVYHAVVDGIFNFQQLKAEDKILKLSNGTVRIDRKGKDSLTFFTTIKAYKGHTLVECKPVTGRMHQIRVHLAQQGASISGDNYYGGKPFYLSSIKKKFTLKKGTEEQPLIKRLALHAFEISFKGLNNQFIQVTAPYPKDFEVVIKQLEKNV